MDKVKEYETTGKEKKWWIACACVVLVGILGGALYYDHNYQKLYEWAYQHLVTPEDSLQYDTIMGDQGDLNAYDAKIVLDAQEHSYTAELRVLVYNDSSDPWSEIFFRDYPSVFTEYENGRVSELSNVRNTRTGAALSWERKEDPSVFSVALDRPLQPGESAEVSMSYKAYVPTLNARFGYQRVGGKGDDYYLGNSLPILCPYEDGAFQYKPYFAVGECFYSQIANYTVDVTLPADYTLIATGEKSEIARGNGTVTYRYQANYVRDFCLVAGNDYQVISGEADGISIDCYFHPDDAADSDAALKLACNSMKNYNRRYGKYPYDTFSVVFAQMEMQGMEYPQMILITTDDVVGVGSIPHELGHQWFYNIVGSNSYASPWIDESITTYVCNDIDSFTGIITWPYNEFTSDEQYTERIYFAGASMYQRLENTYGKEQMKEFIREYLHTYAYREVSPHELVTLLEKYYGKDNDILREYIEEKYF